MDEDIRTGFLLGCFALSFIFTFFFIGGWSITFPLIFLILWIYTIFKGGKEKPQKQNNSM